MGLMAPAHKAAQRTPAVETRFRRWWWFRWGRCRVGSRRQSRRRRRGNYAATVAGGVVPSGAGGGDANGASGGGGGSSCTASGALSGASGWRVRALFRQVRLWRGSGRGRWMPCPSKRGKLGRWEQRPAAGGGGGGGGYASSGGQSGAGGNGANGILVITSFHCSPSHMTATSSASVFNLALYGRNRGTQQDYRPGFFEHVNIRTRIAS